MSYIRYHHRRRSSAPLRKVRGYHQPSFSDEVVIVVTGRDCDLFVNAQPQRGPVIKYAPHPERSLRYSRCRFLSGTGCRPALAGRVALIGMIDRVLCTQAAAPEVKENVDPSLPWPKLGLSGPNIRDVEARQQSGLLDTIKFDADIRHCST
jgi:hypothetical protein